MYDKRSHSSAADRCWHDVIPISSTSIYSSTINENGKRKRKEKGRKEKRKKLSTLAHMLLSWIGTRVDAKAGASRKASPAIPHSCTSTID